MHGNFQSPVEEALVAGIKVLDVGCGSGSWILEMAKDYPNSTFIGTDVDTDAFPKHVERPPNCRFIKADTLNGLSFTDGEFGFVHQRSISFYFILWSTASENIVLIYIRSIRDQTKQIHDLLLYSTRLAHSDTGAGARDKTRRMVGAARGWSHF